MALHRRRLRGYYVFLVVYFSFQLILMVVLRSLNEESHTNALKILKIYKELSVKLDQNTRFDDRGFYNIIQLKQLKSKSAMDITVSTQCSANHIISVDNLFKAWKGPISVSIFSEVEGIEKTLWDISRFIHCNNRREFGMNLIVPIQDTYVKDYKFPYALLHAVSKSVSCHSDYISNARQRKNYNGTSPYPVNLLRNVAKMDASTDFVLVIDVDIIPSPNLREDFLNFIKLRQSIPEKVAYVVPVFETREDVPPPLDKAGLIRAVETNQTRPFYFVPCASCQNLTRYEQWLKSEYHGGTKVLYEVEWKHPWEPFFITRRDVPNYDERFRQFGMNRVSQICELYVAGFKFLVLDNLFLIHKGYKRPDDFHETKNKEMVENERIYNRFKTEIRYKYPDSGRRC